MNVTQQGVITLLRSAITGEKLPLPEGFDLEAADALIQKQGLLPLAYQGAYHCGINPKSERMLAYQQKYFREMLRSSRQLQKAEQLFAAFEENGIDYLPLKGCVLKKLYPQPELRPMGDADILIRMEQYEQIRPIMIRLGFTEDVKSDYDIHWISKELLAEIHFRLFGPSQEDLCRYFEDGWKVAVSSNGSRYVFSTEDTFVYVFCHMAKHFRFMGIGARQLVDLYVYRRAFPGMDEARIEAVMEQIHMLPFYWNVRRMLDVWFEGKPWDPVSEFITEYIFSGGSFGSDEKKLYTEEMLRTKGGEKVANSKARSLLFALFPGLSHMQLSYNILFRYPWLCPVFWVIRWVDILLHRRGNLRRKLNIIGGISDEGIRTHKQALEYMGLGYYATGVEKT